MGLSQPDHDAFHSSLSDAASGPVRAQRSDREQKIRSGPTKPRRPDRAVYVPRALRAEHPPEPKPPDVRKTGPNPENNTKCPKSPVPRDKSQPTTPRRSFDKNFCNVYTPPHLRNQRSQLLPQTDQQTEHDSQNSVDPVPSEYSVPNSVSAIPFSDYSNTYEDYIDKDIGDNFYIGDYYTNGQLGLYTPNVYYNYDNHIVESNDFDNQVFEYSTSHSPDEVEWTNESNDINMELQDPNQGSNIIDVNYTLAYVDKDEDAEKKELKRASQEINRSSKRIIKQSFDSDVLVISDPVEEPKEEPEQVPDKVDFEPAKPKLELKVSLKREENDWDAVFDDSGECLDPSLLEELTATVGKVQITKPKNNYEAYQTKGQALFNGPYDETFAHVVEVYDFPNEFKTNDLLSVFSEYKETGFEIKWVDDTHALIVFSSAKIAAEVLSAERPMVRCRPLHAATLESRNKAKKCAEFLQPYRQRPETCTALARRLVSGALGVKLSTARQERAEERRLITLAREKKRQAALHKEAAWDGSLAGHSGPDS